MLRSKVWMQLQTAVCKLQTACINGWNNQHFALRLPPLLPAANTAMQKCLKGLFTWKIVRGEFWMDILNIPITICTSSTIWMTFWGAPKQFWIRRTHFRWVKFWECFHSDFSRPSHIDWIPATKWWCSPKLTKRRFFRKITSKNWPHSTEFWPFAWPRECPFSRSSPERIRWNKIDQNK